MISGLSVLLVIVSSVLVVVLLARVLPDIGLPLAIAVGAIISPTDAVATSIVRRAGVRARIVTVLDGEPMINDGASLRWSRWWVPGLSPDSGPSLPGCRGEDHRCGVDLTPHQQGQDSDRLQAGALVGPWCPSLVN